MKEPEARLEGVDVAGYLLALFPFVDTVELDTELADDLRQGLRAVGRNWNQTSASVRGK